MSNLKVITIVSGGMDSVTLCHLLDSQGYKQHLVSFDYGQRHKKELTFAALTAIRLQSKHTVINLPITDLLKGSSLTDKAVEVPHGHYEASTMVDTIVPGRNSIMLSIAAGIAAAEKADAVASGVHSGDHFIYPDCRPEFIKAMQTALQLGNGMPKFAILTPFIFSSKTDIVKTGIRLNVPYELTWTCYEGGDIACGRCGTCCERQEAFNLARVEDPLEYKDREMWKKYTKEFKKGN